MTQTQRHILIDLLDEQGDIRQKIAFPHLEDIQKHHVHFESAFEHILLMTYETGTLDTNSHLAMVAYVHEGKLKLFIEYENPEYRDYSTEVVDYQSYQQSFWGRDFFMEAMHMHYAMKLGEKSHSTTRKVKL